MMRVKEFVLSLKHNNKLRSEAMETPFNLSLRPLQYFSI